MPIFGAIIFLRIIDLAVGIEDGGGDDEGAGWEVSIDGGIIGRRAGGGGGVSIISSTFGVGSEMTFEN